MLKLKNKNAKRSVAISRIGIDVGSYSTKVVRRRAGEEDLFLCTEFRTGVSPTNSAQEGPSTAGELEPEVEDSPGRRRRDNMLNLSRWSQKQIDALVSKISTAVGVVDRGTILQATLSMATCDLRSVQVASVESPDYGQLKKHIAELTHDPRPRSLAVVPSGDKHNNVKVVSVPEDLVDGIAIALDSHGMTPHAIEATPWSMAKTIDSTKSTIMLDLGFAEPTLIAKNQQGVQYIRRMRRGGFAKVLAPMMDRFGLTSTEATRLYLESMDPERTSSIDIGVRDEARIEFKEAVRENCKTLAKEIDSALEFISWKFEGFDRKMLLLQGGLAEDHNVVDLLKQSVGSEIRIVEEDSPTPIGSRFTKAASLAGWRYQP